jgi:hypothetical protein
MLAVQDNVNINVLSLFSSFFFSFLQSRVSLMEVWICTLLMYVVFIEYKGAVVAAKDLACLLNSLMSRRRGARCATSATHQSGELRNRLHLGVFRIALTSLKGVCLSMWQISAWSYQTYDLAQAR